MASASAPSSRGGGCGLALHVRTRRPPAGVVRATQPTLPTHGSSHICLLGSSCLAALQHMPAHSLATQLLCIFHIRNHDKMAGLHVRLSGYSLRIYPPSTYNGHYPLAASGLATGGDKFWAMPEKVSPMREPPGWDSRAQCVWKTALPKGRDTPSAISACPIRFAPIAARSSGGADVR